MGRSGWSEWDDSDPDVQWAQIRQGGAIKSALRGRRGKKFLTDLAAALDAMPEKRLVEEDLVTDEGAVCTLGCLLKARGADPGAYDPEDHEGIAKALDIAPILVQHVEWENDEYSRDDEGRWHWMRKWVASELEEIERYEARRLEKRKEGQANSIREAEKMLGRKLAKTDAWTLYPAAPEAEKQDTHGTT